MSVLSFGRMSETFHMNRIPIPRILTIFDQTGLNSMLRLLDIATLGNLKPLFCTS